ncbi:AsmA family protein [bacterium]|nr:AsmA family protein [bacterium]
MNPRSSRLSWHAVQRFLLWVICVFALLIVSAIAFIASPYFAPNLSNWLSGKSGRTISFEKGIHISWGKDTRIRLGDVKIANADWASSPSIFEAERIELVIRLPSLLKGKLVIPEFVAIRPVIALEKNEKGQSNWDLTQNPEALAAKAPLPEERGEIPLFGRLYIEEGKLTYIDKPGHISTNVDISTVRGKSDGEEENISVAGKGEYQKQPFSLSMRGASLLQLRNNDTPYPFNLKIGVGKTHAEVKGTVQDPIKLEKLDITLLLKGANAADLYTLTGIALPPTPPYEVKGHLVREADYWNFSPFSGRLGSSDLHGSVTWHPEQKPPYFQGEFLSENLDMNDLAGFVGADKKPVDETRVIPDTPLDISRLAAMNADVVFRGKHVKAPDLLDDFYMNLSLKDKVLTVKPVSFGMAGGSIDANLIIDANRQPLDTKMDVNFRRLSLTKLFAPLAKRYGEKNVSAGYLGGKAKLEGKGKSLRDMLATSNGNIGMAMEGGELSRLLLELVGLDIFKSAQLLVTGDKPVPISCLVGDFGVTDGIMKTREFLVDTKVTNIRGEGQINLKDEGLNMRLVVYPKDATLISARSPINVTGTLKKPTVGVDPVALTLRGGAAVVLGALLTPAGALLAFVEPGLGDEGDCATFIRNYGKDVAANAKASPSK